MLTSKLSVKILISLAAFNHASLLRVLSEDLSIVEIWRYHQHQVSLLGVLAGSPKQINLMTR